MLTVCIESNNITSAAHASALAIAAHCRLDSDIAESHQNGRQTHCIESVAIFQRWMENSPQTPCIEFYCVWTRGAVAASGASLRTVTCVRPLWLGCYMS